MRMAGLRAAWAGESPWTVLLVAAICIGSALAKLVILEPVGPIVFFDELLYMQGARAMAGLEAYPSGQYPFGYPLLLAPAIALGAGYPGVYLVNVVLSSLLPFAVWLLAREVAPRRAVLAAGLSCLLPFHYLYPTQVMAESLYIPLFVACTWYAVRGRYDGPLAAAGFGALLASTFLTKYIALPGVVLLLVFWVFTLAVSTRARRVPALAGACAGLAAGVVVAAWLVYAGSQGIGVREALGGKVSGLKAGDLITLESVATWTLLYAASALLLCGPFLGVVLYRLAASVPRWWRPGSWGPMERLLLLFLMLAGGYVLVCVQHSAGALMNYPVPQRIIVRYLMHLTPLAVVIGLAGAGVGGGPGRVVAAVAAAALVYGGWLLFYGSNVFGLPHWFADIPLYSADIMVFKTQGVAIGVALMAALLPFLGGAVPLLAGALAVAVLLVAGGRPLLAQGQELTSVRPLHARALAPVLLDAAAEGQRTRVYSGFERLSLVELRQALQFWGVPRGTFEVVGASQRARTGGYDRELLITPERLEGRELLREYRFGPRTGHVYAGPPPAPDTSGPERERHPEARVGYRGEAACTAESAATGRLEWAFPGGGSGQVAVYVQQGAGGEKLFAMGGATGTEATGKWVLAGTRFLFRDASSGELLRVLPMEPGCAATP